MRIYHVRVRERTEEKDGKQVRVKQSVREPRLLRKYRKKSLADLVITNAAGKKLTAKEVLNALQKPTIVLISSDGKKVDPYYLRIVRPGTLVIVVKGKPWSDVIDSSQVNRR